MTLPAFPEVEDRKCENCKWWADYKDNDFQGLGDCKQPNRLLELIANDFICDLWQPKED